MTTSLETSSETNLRIKTDGLRMKDRIVIALAEPFKGQPSFTITDQDAEAIWQMIEDGGGLYDSSEMTWTEIRAEFVYAWETLQG